MRNILERISGGIFMHGGCERPVREILRGPSRRLGDARKGAHAQISEGDKKSETKHAL